MLSVWGVQCVGVWDKWDVFSVWGCMCVGWVECDGYVVSVQCVVVFGVYEIWGVCCVCGV